MTLAAASRAEVSALTSSRLLKKPPFRNELVHLATGSRAPPAQTQSSGTATRTHDDVRLSRKCAGTCPRPGLEPTQDQQAEVHRHPVETISILLGWAGAENSPLAHLHRDPGAARRH